MGSIANRPLERRETRRLCRAPGPGKKSLTPRGSPVHGVRKSGVHSLTDLKQTLRRQLKRARAVYLRASAASLARRDTNAAEAMLLEKRGDFAGAATAWRKKLNGSGGGAAVERARSTSRSRGLRRSPGTGRRQRTLFSPFLPPPGATSAPSAESRRPRCTPRARRNRAAIGARPATCGSPSPRSAPITPRSHAT